MELNITWTAKYDFFTVNIGDDFNQIKLDRRPNLQVRAKLGSMGFTSARGGKTWTRKISGTYYESFIGWAENNRSEFQK